FDHDKAYFFQGEDGRIIFAIPYETDFTLIGTTDADHDDVDVKPTASDIEQDYLVAFANEYFEAEISRDDIVWTYSGVRPLYDDGAKSATAATRDYVLTLNDEGAPLLNIFGGKITTYRKLAENALKKLGHDGAWTAGVALPGGDFSVGDVTKLQRDLMAGYPFLSEKWAIRLTRAYGRDAAVMLGDAVAEADLGADFGATITARELDWLKTHEFAQTADDVVWRRSKLGLRLTADQIAAIDAYLKAA
ncbi:MAG: FAD-dependent oxidoreductase, partial [Yoonia sp.]